MRYRFRALWANLIAYRIIFSYWRLNFLGKLLGQSYKSQRIEKLHKKNALRIKNGITRLGGLFIKVGQLISILSNFLPDSYREPLESLQDHLPPRPFNDIQLTIQQELGKSIPELFKHFNEQPLGTASIGQTHQASLLDGTSVVVKIQHKDIQRIAKIDLNIIKSLVKQISWIFSIKGLDYLYQQVSIMIAEELDYQHEAKASIRISDNLRKEKSVTVPSVFEAYSTSSILTTSYFDGAKITNHQKLDEWQIDKKAISKKIIQLYCKMIFEDDIYHADPHPGNILINKTGQICIIDFGAVTSLSPTIKSEFPQLIISLTKQDASGTVDSLRKMGFVASGKEATDFAQKIVQIAQDFIHHEVKIDTFDLEGIQIDPNSKAISKLFKDLDFKELSSSVQIPKDWILLQRTIVLILGTAVQLSADLNPMDVIKPYLKKMVLTQNGGLKKIIFDTIKSQASAIIGLPNAVKKAMDTIQQGELHTTDLQQTKALGRINQSIRLVGVILLTLGLFFLSHLYTDLPLENWFFYGGIIGLVMVFRKLLWSK